MPAVHTGQLVPRHRTPDTGRAIEADRIELGERAAYDLHVRPFVGFHGNYRPPTPIPAPKDTPMTITEEPTAQSVLLDIPLDQLHARPDNVREHVDGTDLVPSINAVGILQPLNVTARADGTGYDVNAGHRRLHGAQLAGLDTVPCYVDDRFEEGWEISEAMLIENLMRTDLNPVEEARGYRVLVDAGRNQKQVAEAIGVSQSVVSRRLKLLELPDVGLERVVAGDLSLEDAEQYLKLPEDQMVTAVARWWNSETVRTELNRIALNDKRTGLIKSLREDGQYVFDECKNWGPFDHPDDPGRTVQRHSYIGDPDGYVMGEHFAGFYIDGNAKAYAVFYDDIVEADIEDDAEPAADPKVEARRQAEAAEFREQQALTNARREHAEAFLAGLAAADPTPAELLRALTALVLYDDNDMGYLEDRLVTLGLLDRDAWEAAEGRTAEDALIASALDSISDTDLARLCMLSAADRISYDLRQGLGAQGGPSFSEKLADALGFVPLEVEPIVECTEPDAEAA